MTTTPDPSDQDGPPVSRRRARGVVLLLLMALAVVMPALLGWVSTRIGQVEGQPRVWADRPEVDLLRVDGECLESRGRRSSRQTICPATWTPLEGAGVSVRGWVGDGHGSRMPEVGESVTARVTEVERVDGEDRLVATTDFGNTRATFQRHPWAFPVGWLVFLSPLIVPLVVILVRTRPR